ncbi:hypothetical protein AAG906_016001 [Vitis piasezkii]
MVKYSRESDNPTKFCKTRDSDFRYLEDAPVHEQAMPFTRFCRGVGRTAQAKNRHSNGQGCSSVKSVKYILVLLKHAESNADLKGLDVNSPYISHIQVTQA